MNNPIAITGLGPVTAIGIGRSAFCRGLRDGACGIGEVTQFDTAPYGSRKAAVIGNFNVETYLPSCKTYMDRSAQFAMAAMRLAIEDSGLDVAGGQSASFGLGLGSKYGPLTTIGMFYEGLIRKGPRFARPFLFPHAYSNTAAALAAIEYGLTGPHMNFSSGALSSAHAAVWGANLVKMGTAPAVFVGGYESFGEIGMACEALAGMLSPGSGGAERCLPFGKGRNGTVLGEAGAILALESIDHAAKRNARIYCEIAGIGQSGIGGSAGILESMKLALAESGIGLSELDCIFAAGSGRVQADTEEARAIREFSGADIPVTTPKPLLGDTLGADAALRIAAAACAVADGYIPPLFGLTEPETPPGLLFPPGDGVSGPVRGAMVNCFDPGGAAVSFVVSGPGNGR